MTIAFVDTGSVAGSVVGVRLTARRDRRKAGVDAAPLPEQNPGNALAGFPGNSGERERSVMRRLLLMLAGLASAVLALAASASANTTASVSIHFTEPIVPGFVQGCPVADRGFCGSGEVVPLGHATETIEFGFGCGGTCDLRTIYLAGGTILINESFSDFRCPGVCGSRGLGQPGSGTLTATVIGGTGVYAGATGSLSGTVKAAGLQSQITISGTISFDP